ncbi:MAG: 4-hydroxy-tetrahydrodipicolinate reductase [Oceanicaulis sp.]
MSDVKLKAAVCGVSGRLGRTIAHQLIGRIDTALTGGMVSSDSVHLGADLGEIADKGYLGVTAAVALEDAVADADILIDVSAPQVVAAVAGRLTDKGGPGLVTGTTGLDDDQQAALEAAAKTIPVLQASNFSLGVAVVERLVAEAARALKADQFDLEIVETHHKRKADAPSGTALTLGKAAARARGETFDTVAQFDRPRSGGSRPMGQIGFAALRGGGVVGEHEARFLSALEEVSVAHRAFDRFIFARGAVEAALWLKDKKPGRLYTMQDVLG